MRKWFVGVLIAAAMAAPTGSSVAEASAYPWGMCTWWAAHMRPDIGYSVSGNAWYWSTAAVADGFRVDGRPTVGAVAVFQPGVQGAWGAGHVAYVTSVGSAGWFQVSEMDFPYAGNVTYRWAHTGWGVTFIH